MANELDPRLLRIGIEVDGTAKYYEDIYIAATGTKYANSLQNEATIKITNLSKDTRDYILTQTSPFQRRRIPRRIIVQAGRVSTGLSTIFVGDIIAAIPSQPPDIALTIKAATLSSSATDIVSRSKSQQTLLSSIAAGVAKDLGLQSVFEATDKQISNYTYTGGISWQVKALASAGGVNAYIDDDKLVVKDHAKYLSGGVETINADNGMIGVPQINEQGVKVTFLFNRNVKVGGGMKIESKINPAANGTYTIFKLSWNLTNRENAFYMTAEGMRLL